MNDDIEAIPTLFNGVWYKSRLEARFAETLFEVSIDYQYEKHLPGSSQKYSCDFWIPSHNLYVEIKPKKFLKETFLFENDIRLSGSPWICVDQRGRSSWNVIEYNDKFSGWCHFHLPCKIVFSEEISIFPKFYNVARWSKPKEPDPKPVELPSGEGHARLHFQKMRKLLGGDQ